MHLNDLTYEWLAINYKQITMNHNLSTTNDEASTSVEALSRKKTELPRVWKDRPVKKQTIHTRGHSVPSRDGLFTRVEAPSRDGTMLPRVWMVCYPSFIIVRFTETCRRETILLLFSIREVSPASL